MAKADDRAKQDRNPDVDTTDTNTGASTDKDSTVTDKSGRDITVDENADPEIQDIVRNKAKNGTLPNADQLAQ